MIEILKPVYETTLFVESRNSNAGHVIPLFKKIQLDLILKPKTELYLNVCKAIVDGLKKRLKSSSSFEFTKIFPF